MHFGTPVAVLAVVVLRGVPAGRWPMTSALAPASIAASAAVRCFQPAVLAAVLPVAARPHGRLAPLRVSALLLRGHPAPVLKVEGFKAPPGYQVVGDARRVQKRAGIFMMPARRLTIAMKGIAAVHIKEHGAGSQVAQRKAPFAPVLTRALLSTACGTALGTKNADCS